MLILGIDTSTKICTCSIFDSENGVIAETSLSVKKNHSNIVMPIIDNLFKISDLNINDIDKIVVAIGPGSFTGVRIALGIAKGLAMALNKPLIAVNELDILEAIANGNENEIIPLIDARKERVYCKYQNKYVDDYLINLISNFDKNKKYVFVGDGAINYENIEDAKARGAMALFSNKYGDIVRVVEIDGYSIELCGGTHVKSTGEIGLFNIESESGIASGTRRITATTGHKSLNYVNRLEEKIKEISDIFRTDEKNVVDIIEKYIGDMKAAVKVHEEMQTKLVKYEINELLENVDTVNGIKVLKKSFENKSIDELKEIVDRGKEKLQSGVIILGSDNEKAIFVAGVTKDLISKVKAGDIVKVAAQVTGGNGGGRPDFAQAGGKDGNAVGQAVEKAFEYIVSQLS